MTLWFDVTDIRDWEHPYLTGIQRTVVNVLLELLESRNDIRLFAFVRSERALRQVDMDTLPPAVLKYIRSSRTGEVSAHNTAAIAAGIDSRSRYFPKVSLRRRIKKWIGSEATQALRDLRSGGKAVARIFWRKINFATPASISRTAVAPLQISPGSILFRPGDICVSLSATWGLPHYGEVIAANKVQGGAKCINLIYDLIPALFPQWMLPGYSDVVSLWALQQMENADLILTISNFQKGEISKYMETERISPRPIEVVRLGDNPNFMASIPPSKPLPLPRYVPDRKFVICVSSLDVRKNQSLLYQVWRRLAEELGPDCPQLLLIGIQQLYVSDLLHQMRTDPLVSRLIIHMDDVVDEELAWYYRNCEFTVYPSVYEGWGLPVSESLSLGKYCIAGNRTSLTEAGGDLVDYFDPLDFIGCHKLIHRAVADPGYVKQREQQIRANYVPYTWAETASHISKIVDRLAGPARQEK
ncbi:MAG: glycosyltransferase family 1 protein [Afipia sp.]|nr:glycosyltransferase family 1 protein [Afipia sp.]